MTFSHATARALIGATLLSLAATAPSFAAPPQTCSEAIETAKADWRSLSHGSHLAPTQPIVTSDGRHLNGTEVNYAWVLIDRAESACASANRAEALGYAAEAQTLLHPAPITR